MRYDTNHPMAGVSNTTFSVFIFALVCLFLLAVLLFCPGCERDTSPPDLSSCTRLEIRYPRSTLNYFLPVTDIQRSVLSPDERKHIQSIEFFTVIEPERIKAFADDVSSGSYDGRRRVAYNEIPVEIRCYRNNEHVISFTVFKDLIVTEDWCHFKYPRGKGLPNLEIIEPQEMQPFKLRSQCGSNMQRVYASGPLYSKKVTFYPQPTGWCDTIMRERTNTSYVGEEEMRGWFKCPAAGEGECHYAINPLCEPNSPPDMVLLFETKAGWNQHGGPELFTFEHHELRGGCVMLNDGTVKFIRTKEELQQLRWK